MSRRYAQIAKKLAGEIADGVYPVGSRLPNEHALAGTLGVSRSTVRAALDELQKLGMVSRRPSLGTRIEASLPHGSGDGFTQNLSSIDAIVQYAASTLRDGLHINEIVADTELALRIGVISGSRWLKISYRRIDKSDLAILPICWTDVYVDDEYASSIKERIQSHKGAISELVEEFSGRPISQVEQSIRACGIPEEISAFLDSPVDSHALEITRRYILGNNDLALLSISIHPGNRFSYVSRLSRTI